MFFIEKVFRNFSLFTIVLLFSLVSEVWYISDKCWLPNKLHASHLSPLVHFSIKSILYRRSFKKHSLFTTFLLVFTMSELCHISNTDPPISQQNNDVLRKRSYLPFSEEIGALHLKGFRNFHFLPNFHYFWEWMKCVILTS